ncbi:Uncharacterized conserved protein [Burkholderia pseudomallei]|uniref:DUF262 domain-containing protein n=1 Tax=Burkholderia pseudomallei TaxID=28450 RepID=UPI000977418E|nr:DUF262 domain-containing protein [Burkholderia pseudomallei]MBF4045302.1 DUF262 domain-containing protein [Burkholderia pseudomallei]OMU10742.1 hypothetical protein AQ768_01620 [Burkholderia pseudomallei]CAJ3540187.1 Uncharacterized conserved protein [Burkholderia pseudomallei]CAJ4981738.1 Uncharacterized conserved protein [Burkholderia pseudomallei]CAJ5300136.1 Uncharacterized conserved protein [Burkholderia pseudomallei]
MAAQLSLRPISDLLGERFIIPSYQRGYRWTKRQVIELLDDIWEFQALADAGGSAFYCLQPVVVKRHAESGDWELVDGQQRLTTIHLILTFLRDLMKALGQDLFRLTYETRKDSEAFLQHIDPTQADRNIDYFHICGAYAAIEHWFEGRHGSHRMKILQALVNDEKAGKNVKVIWYELSDAQAAIPAFTRLNVGKIPLTNSELVRALFLRSGNFATTAVTQEQLRIAQEWDAVEKVLQSDEFWYYMHSGTAIPQNRIEYLFDLYAQVEGWRAEPGDPYSTFHFFHQRLQEEKRTVGDEWLRVKQSFMSLEEWFNDRVLYHLVGFLVHEGDNIRELQALAQGAAKSAFRAKLRERIARKIGISCDSTHPPTMRAVVDAHLADLEYGRDSRRIRAILLLFNVATLLANPRSNLRFPFDTFKKEAWDIEHVKAVASNRPEKADAQRLWLQNVAGYFAKSSDDQDLNTRIDILTAEDGNYGLAFDALYDEILRRVGEDNDPDVDNGIGNLALLDKGTNRAYKNAIFPVKRRWILELDEAGTFVPLCTRNVFLKCYSKDITNMLFWSTRDADSYQAEIASTLSKFFTVDGEAA